MVEAKKVMDIVNTCSIIGALSEKKWHSLQEEESMMMATLK
jgi:hypothetical protein